MADSGIFGYGGAIYNYIANGAALTVTDSTFTDNTATNWGNAISNDGDLSLSGNTIFHFSH